MEVELVVQKKKKKKKNKKYLTEELPEASSTHLIVQDTHDEQSHQKKSKKKKTKGYGSGGDSPVVHVDAAERKLKKEKKHKGEKKVRVHSPMAEKDSNYERMEGTKKRKKRRLEEDTEHCIEGEEEGTEVTPIQTTSEAAGQKPAKTKSEKCRKRAEMSPATGTQPQRKARREKCAGVNKEAILLEMKEYIPDIRITCLESIYKCKLYDLPRFREFKKQGIPIRTGRLTVAEKERLKQNVKDFLALSGIESETKLFLPHRFPDEKNIIRQKRKFGFLKFLCEGIPRRSQSIHISARDMLNEENFLGRFTDKENQELLKLCKQHGRKWRLISEKMGRSSESLKKRFQMTCEAHGPWTEEELGILLTSVQQHLLKQATPGEDGSIGSAVVKKVDLYKHLPWVKVSKQVQTRSWLHCRGKWMTYLTYKLRTGRAIKGRKILESQIQLIKAINEMVVEDATDVVWDDLTDLFGNAHPDYLKMKFHQLKVAHVPGWNTMSDFCDVIDYLYEKTLPQLEEELKNCREEEEEPTEERDSYRLSEIFPDL